MMAPSGRTTSAADAGEQGGPPVHVFRTVHGGVRGTQQAVLVAAVFRCKSQADTAPQGNQVSLDLEGVRKHAEQAITQKTQGFPVVDVGKDGHELVAAHPAITSPLRKAALRRWAA